MFTSSYFSILIYIFTFQFVISAADGVHKCVCVYIYILISGLSIFNPNNQKQITFIFDYIFLILKAEHLPT